MDILIGGLDRISLGVRTLEVNESRERPVLPLVNFYEGKFTGLNNF